MKAILKTMMIRITSRLLNLNSHICYADIAHEIGWRDTLRWFIEDKLSKVFSWAYAGSDEELSAVDNDEVPEKYMSERQLTYFFSKSQRDIPNT